MAKAPMTQAGFDKLVKEHTQLLKVDLPAIIEKVAEARANGDLKENAEYHAAREKQGHMQDKLRQLEESISTAQIIEIIGDSDTVVFGSKVVIVEIDEDGDEDDDEEEYTLVGSDEADASEGLISITSPIGKSLLGKKDGDAIDIETPGGLITLKIKSFE